MYANNFRVAMEVLQKYRTRTVHSTQNTVQYRTFSEKKKTVHTIHSPVPVPYTHTQKN